MSGRKAALHNLGCKVNAYETEAIQEMLEEAGYTIVPFAPGADVYLINTCTVTNIADRKSRQMLHKARKMNPDAVVVAMGCYVQADKEKLEKDETIDIIIGNNKKQELLSILESYRREDGPAKEIQDMSRKVEYENLKLSRAGEHTRAYLKVQDGCNQFCSYCIIPYVRGRVRSRRREDVAAEAKRLAASGYQEFVLTGIHLSSYGIDCGDDLLSLIQTVHAIDKVKRIRLGSLEPRIVTEDFVRELSRLPKLCPHFHLSLQSGCDATLERMNRKYDSRDYREACRLLRRYFIRPALTTDIIVGFPQETEEEFAQSRAFIDEMDFYETHIFKYSRRAGTKADKMEGQIPESIKAGRSQSLIELGEQHRINYMESFLGQEVEILLEEKAVIQGKEYWVGHTREYLRAAIDADGEWENHIVMGKTEGLLAKDTMLCAPLQTLL